MLTSIQSSGKILVVEDETLFARAVIKRLQKEGFMCEHAENLSQARMLQKQYHPDMVLLDMRLPDGNGTDLLIELVRKEIPTMVMTAFGEVSDAVNAMKLGAIDYLKKPIDLEELFVVVNKNIKTTALLEKVHYSRLRDEHAIEGVQLIGQSIAMDTVKQQIKRIAQLSEFTHETPPTILISGETGTGKDVVARYLHASCPNGDKPFVHVDCASLPAELIESELFGHEKGAFTNAVVSRPGLIESAEDGTLFLDEIGELPLALQAKLLNVLERRQVRRLGASKERPVRARIIAATNRNLHDMVSEGRFRSDLYYRLNVISINMPPLFEREGDAVLLAHYFKQLTERRYNLSERTFSASALGAIKSYRWPGNVRELKHLISRSVLLGSNQVIQATDLGLPLQTIHLSAQQMHQKEANLSLVDAEKAMIIQALEQTRYNVSKAARLLGITRMTMRYRIEKHGISI